MVLRWTVEDLDPELLFEVVYNTDPDTASRFSWPIPNWLDANGKPIIEHEDLVYSEKKGDFRFRFTNYVDGCEQLVKANGTGCILFMTPTAGQAQTMKNIIRSYSEDWTQLTPEMVTSALDKIYDQTAIIDRWNSDYSDLDRKYNAVDDVEDGYLGRFVYKHSVSSALHIKGTGLFDGVAASDQKFEDGAFIVFPDKKREQAQEIIKQYDVLNPVKTGAKVVGQSEFLKTRRHEQGPNKSGLPIKLYKLTSQTEPKKRYYAPKPIAGFKDNSTELEVIESQWLRTIEDVYGLYGFPKIKTRIVEELSVLRREEGLDNTSKIFAVKPAFTDVSAFFGLRFDHTVPLARYIAENRDKIQSPFKSARIGPVFRIQEVKRGHQKEFTQADIDIVDLNHVEARYDSEFPRIMNHVVSELGIEEVEIGVSNRKITQGFFKAHDFDDKMINDVVRLIELRHEIGIEGVRYKLANTLGLGSELIDLIVQFALINTSDDSFEEEIKNVGTTGALIDSDKGATLKQGILELKSVINALTDLPEGSVKADMSVVRGMDYYTGTVYEGRCKDHMEFPPIIMGGRYDNLVGHYMKENRPGVGISLDVTRALELMIQRNKIDLGARTSTKVLVTYDEQNDVNTANEHAKKLRSRGIASEVVYGAHRLRKQLEYANKKGIPFVLINDFTEGVTIKNMETGEQGPVDIKTWKPNLG